MLIARTETLTSPHTESEAVLNVVIIALLLIGLPSTDSQSSVPLESFEVSSCSLHVSINHPTPRIASSQRWTSLDSCHGCQQRLRCLTSCSAKHHASPNPPSTLDPALHGIARVRSRKGAPGSAAAGKLPHSTFEHEEARCPSPLHFLLVSD